MTAHSGARCAGCQRRISGTSDVVAVVGDTEPMLRMLATGLGFDGIAGPFGVAGAGKPLGVLLLGGTIDLRLRSRRGSLYGLPLDRFTEPWLPTGSITRRIVEKHERCSSGSGGPRSGAKVDFQTL